MKFLNSLPVTRFKPFSLNIKGRLITWERPVVMAIINVTPDSFYAPSRVNNPVEIARRAERLIAAGADIIDVGAYSTRPGAPDVSPDEELVRLEAGMKAIRSVDRVIPVSVDTFRADIARKAVEEFGADIVNDISGGTYDDAMIDTVASLKVPYVLMHTGGDKTSLHSRPEYGDVTADVLARLSERLAALSLAGVADVVVDPGFGFGKIMEDNYRLLHDLEMFLTLGCPVLVGVSRKSMIYNVLNVGPEDAKIGTAIINTLALERGASILRVHDPEDARHAVALLEKLNIYN